MRFRENRVLASLIALAAVLSTILISGGARLSAQRAAAEDIFYNGNTGSGQCIHTDIAARLDAACNLITLAGRYMPSGDAQLEALSQAAEALQAAEDISALHQANQNLDAPAQALYQTLSSLSLSERDQILLKQQYSDLSRRIDSIRRDAYNESARHYNQEISGLPARFIAALTGNKPLQTFD